VICRACRENIAFPMFHVMRRLERGGTALKVSAYVQRSTSREGVFAICTSELILPSLHRFGRHELSHAFMPGISPTWRNIWPGLGASASAQKADAVRRHRQPCRCGVYDLRGEEAVRTGEAADGIGRLAVWTAPPALKTISNWRARRGLSRFAADRRQAAEPQDRLVAVEKHPKTRRRWPSRSTFRRLARRTPTAIASRRLLPPPNGAPLLIDLHTSRRRIRRSCTRLANALPVLRPGSTSSGFRSNRRASGRLCGEVLAAVQRGAASGLMLARAAKTFDGAGLVVVNPPFGFEDEMRALALALPLMGAGAVLWLARGE